MRLCQVPPLQRHLTSLRLIGTPIELSCRRYPAAPYKGTALIFLKLPVDRTKKVCYFKSISDMSMLDISRHYMSRNDRGGG